MEERAEALDLFFETLRYADPAELNSPKQIAEELQSSLGVPLSLSGSEQRMLLDDPEEAEEMISQQVAQALSQTAVTRLTAALERRLGIPLGLNPNELAQQDWETIAKEAINAVQANFDDRRNRLLGENGDGLLAKELHTQLKSIKEPIDQQHLIRMLLGMTQGEATAFDKRTHRQIKIRVIRFNPVYYTASLLEQVKADELTKRVLAHLDQAQQALKIAWGKAMWEQVKSSSLDSVDESIQKRFQHEYGEQSYMEQKTRLLNKLGDEQQQFIIRELGRWGVTNTYRGLILRVISQLWVEYLTQMEALRISIGLEAYAQRDPLVQYKASASEMFQKLFSDMRMGVISRMFTIQPRQAAVQHQAQALVGEPETMTEADQVLQEDESATQEATSPSDSQPSNESGSKRKRKRRRKRK